MKPKAPEEFPIEKSFDRIKFKGLKKIVLMIKLVLKEIPRLKQGLQSKDLVEQTKMKAEIFAIFRRLHLEVVAHSKETGKPIELIWKELDDTSHFSAQELALIKQSIILPRAAKIPGQQHSFKKPTRRKRIRIRV